MRTVTEILLMVMLQLVPLIVVVSVVVEASLLASMAVALAVRPMSVDRILGIVVSVPLTCFV